MGENYERKFWQSLKELFVGARVEGKSGYVNLMRVKSNYFKEFLEPELECTIEVEIEKHPPHFKEELYTKLYSFFHRYFSESGSIYFSYTPLYYKIYEKVYENGKEKLKEVVTYSTDYEQILSDREDVTLFWKTHMLYYIKTDRIIRSMKIDIEDEGFSFYFDAKDVELKKGNEKKQLIYEIERIEKDGTIVLKVLYSERGKKTKIEDILKKARKKFKSVTEDTIKRAIRIFEKQATVDYFINKDAEGFLKEQFDLWMYQYLFSQEVSFTQKRFEELMSLKRIAYKTIELIAKFEEELKKIWEKPRFVFNSNYVITLDRIAKKEGGTEVIKELLNHPGMEEQIKEWKELGIIGENFKKEKILIKTLQGEELNEEFQFLPVDTKYFKEVKWKILELFDNLDDELDGWLIKSENWQALNTILPKFREKVQTIYIDPPFNLGTNADFHYEVNYKDSTWITMLENRLSLAKEFINETGSIFVRCDYNGNMYVRMLLDKIFGRENFLHQISINRRRFQMLGGKTFSNRTENLILFAKKYSKLLFNKIRRKKENPEWKPLLHLPGDRENPERYIGNKKILPPKGRHFGISQKSLDIAYKEGRIRFNEKGYPEIFVDTEELNDNWTDIEGYSFAWNFSTENAEILLKRCVETASNENDLVLDFFLGSGTTTAVAHKLKRKWIGIEMGEHFWTVVLPRMKKVLAYDKTGISREKDVKEKYNPKNAGGFFKYYELEQYEEILQTVEYSDTDIKEYVENLRKLLKDDFTYSKIDPFIFDKKLSKALEVDEESSEVTLNLSKLYPDKEIDIAETLSNVKGLKIKKLTRDYVEFENGETVYFNNLKPSDFKELLIW